MARILLVDDSEDVRLALATILEDAGYEVVEATDMPAIAADSLSIALGDFKRGYKIIDRLGIRVLRDPFTAKPFVVFDYTKRVGGDVVVFEAIKIQKLSA